MDTITNKKEKELIFYENFENLDNWNFEYGFIRNEELQYYTDKNIELENGLTIYGKEEKIENENYDNKSTDYRKNRRYADYSSSSINTKGKFEFKYGILEVKAKIPTADGAWPAIWLLGSDEEWPYSDEVDVMEYYLYNNRPSILGNFMYYNEDYIWSTKAISLNYFKEKDEEWENKFHIWKLDWTDKYMKIYLDNELINEINISKIKGSKFKKKYFILLNLAIGKNGFKPSSSDMPLKYVIEYVKVYKQ